MAGNRDPLEQLLREVGGNLSAALERLRSVEQLSLPDFALRCREGKEALMQRYGLPGGSAERIAQADLDLFMKIEELDLPATTNIELNTAPDGEPPTWQSLQALSTGQKATAVLLLLLTRIRGSTCSRSTRGRPRQQVYYRGRCSDHATGEAPPPISLSPRTTRTSLCLATQN